jgi:ABC-type multidrug transport system ATPase subunit
MSWVRLIGESGAGKSTVAREVAFRLNKINSNLSAREQYIVDKNSDLILKLINSDMDNWSAIYIGPRFTPNLYHNYDKEPKWLLDILDLNLNKNNLSQGEMQRFVLIEALSHNPGLLILDEALSGVSIDLEYEILKILKKQYSINLIYITHRESPAFKEIFDNWFEIK